MSSRKQDPGSTEPAADSATPPTGEPSLRPLDALKIELDELEEGPHELAVELPQAWIAEILAETDAIAQTSGAVRLELTLQADRTLLVRGRIDQHFAVPCARCLEPAGFAVGAETEDLCVTFVPADRLRSWTEAPGGGDSDDDDIEPLEPTELDELGYHGSTVDLRGLISEQILLAYPIRILCGRGEACRGLCMRCGADLNKLIPEGAEADRCPSCNARFDGIDDEGPETPWKQALSKLPKN
jgi:uncharacterized metal-binding protein YceD (DUF177 family)